MNAPEKDTRRKAQEKKEWVVAIAVGIGVLFLIVAISFLSNLRLWGF